MEAALATFVWFLWLSTVGLRTVWFWIPFFAIVAGLVWTLAHAAPIPYWKLLLLTSLPVLWIFIGLWGSYFWLTNPAIPNPAWVHYPLGFGIWLFLPISIALIVYLREARLFASLFVVLNLYFMVAMTFLANMAVTGTWL